ncbi:MAG: tRNA (adenosine(37)-N6)-threonylcarbamoyltransferase complex ATPase subunit type 1 TsaE [Daejeonella sp.]|uniref:tRNA (adenosine(37)-N6)-threonylcarbamoyltransferase complex ATPase subunit type 1 TsaE n=1 Tax=Daejeonella sp. TaxID=2805397 RepID=UPI003C77A5F0
MEILLRDINELPDAARQLLDFSTGERVFLFEGPMGAGKTTFIKFICEELGVDDTASSPTYSIVNEYNSPLGQVFHFDFFRIKSEIEAYDLGFEEYAYSGNYCFIEWPERIEGLWPRNYIKVIMETDENLRTIHLSKI